MASGSDKLTTEERLEQVLQVLLAYTRMDFNEQLEVSEEEDEIDAIATGINILGEELSYSVEKDKETRKQLEEKTKKLEARNKELEQFIYITSHDLQEPLRTVFSLTGILNDQFSKELGKEGQEMMAFVNESVTRMSDLIHELLNYLIIDSQKTKVTVDLNKEMKRSQERVAAHISDHKAELIIDELPTIEAFQELIGSVFDNLLCNAIKFKKPDSIPRVEVVYSEDKDFHWVHFIDNGIGIEEQYFERIFKIFQRLHSRKEYKGTGIGLAQVKKIMNVHGGDVMLESTPGEGTKFSISFPKD